MSDKEVKVNYKVYDVGSAELSEWDLKNIKSDGVEWIVYAYVEGSYEGSGTLVTKWADGTFSMNYLGHCSCYGPIDSGLEDSGSSLKSVMADLKCDKDDYDYSYNNAVRVKVAELTGFKDE